MSKVPPLRVLKDENEYRKYYVENYCNNPVKTFDDIMVHFYPNKFDDAFFESEDWSLKDKSIFSRARAERIDWIRYTLQTPKAKLRFGYDSKSNKPRKDRRVALLLPQNYVVIITLLNDKKAKFITAYPINGFRTALLINTMEEWKLQKKDH